MGGIDDLLKARFRKTWFVYAGKNAGKGTLKSPFPYNPKLRLWTGKLSANEIDDLVLATGMNLDPQGYLSRETAAIAVQLNIGYDSTRTIEDEETQLEQLRFASLTVSSYTLNAHYANARDARAFYPAEEKRRQMEQARGLDPVSKEGSIPIKQQQRSMQRSP